MWNRNQAQHFLGAVFNLQQQPPHPTNSICIISWEQRTEGKLISRPNPSPTTPRPMLWRCHCHSSSFTSSAQPIHATVRAVLIAGSCEIGSAPSLQGYLEALQRSSRRTNTGCGCCWYRMGLVIYVFIPTRYVIYLFMSRVCLRSQSRTSDLPVLHWCVLWGS